MLSESQPSNPPPPSPGHFAPRSYYRKMKEQKMLGKMADVHNAEAAAAAAH